MSTKRNHRTSLFAVIAECNCNGTAFAETSCDCPERAFRDNPLTFTDEAVRTLFRYFQEVELNSRYSEFVRNGVRCFTPMPFEETPVPLPFVTTRMPSQPAAGSPFERQETPRRFLTTSPPSLSSESASHWLEMLCGLLEWDEIHALTQEVEAKFAAEVGTAGWDCYKNREKSEWIPVLDFDSGMILAVERRSAAGEVPACDSTSRG